MNQINCIYCHNLLSIHLFTYYNNKRVETSTCEDCNAQFIHEDKILFVFLGNDDYIIKISLYEKQTSIYTRSGAPDWFLSANCMSPALATYDMFWIFPQTFEYWVKRLVNLMVFA